MEGWLKALIAGACLVIIAGGALFLVQQWQGHRARNAAAESQAEAELTSEKCDRLADMTVPEKPGQPAKTDAFFDDLRTCAKLDNLRSYDRHQLELLGVL